MDFIQTKLIYLPKATEKPDMIQEQFAKIKSLTSINGDDLEKSQFNVGFILSRQKTKGPKYRDWTEEEITPLVSKNDKPISIIEAMLNLSHINFIVDESGFANFLVIESYLIARMENMGYKKEEIDKIISQITVIALNNPNSLHNVKSTVVQFIDLAKGANLGNLPAYLKEKLGAKKADLYRSHSNQIVFYYNFKDKETSTQLSDAIIAKILNLLLIRSKTKQMTSNELTDRLEKTIRSIIEAMGQYDSIDELIKDIYGSITYDILSKGTQK
ncbi:MAG: hypothetical protein PHD02_03825 [Bacilli bacterium]|nr:hypothetical protein [Bacilli bacterium]